MILRSTPTSVVIAYCLKNGADSQAAAEGLIAGIRAKWRVSDAQARPERLAEFRAQLELAIHDAWNRPVFDKETGEPILNEDGTICVSTDGKVLALLLRLKAQLNGFLQERPNQHLHIHGNRTEEVGPAPRSLTPAERQAEIQRLLDKRASSLSILRARELDTEH
jgi:hypothetical protein